MYHKIKLFNQSKETTRKPLHEKHEKQLRMYQDCIRKLKNSFKARKQQEKPLHKKQENNLELIKNVSQN